ncbi:MAG: VWA domain-containing protein [Verrucomicrobiota bacterium]
MLLLLALPLLAWLKGRQGRAVAFVYSSVDMVKPDHAASRASAGALLANLRWLVLGVLILALAQPRLTHTETSVSASGVDIVVAADLSGSMIAEDFEIKGKRLSRIAMLKEVLSKFIAKRTSDRIGLVAFAARAYVASPLTLDHDFLQQNLSRLQQGTIQEDGTAIGSALMVSLNRLEDVKSKSRIVILMTDGQNNAGKVAPLTAADAAKALGIKVYTIGIGTRGQAPMPVRNIFGQMGYQMVPVDIDEDTLKQIADRTGGQYYRADNAEKFRDIYQEIDRMEKTEINVKKVARHTELAHWFALGGLGLLLLELLLANTVLRRLP